MNSNACAYGDRRRIAFLQHFSNAIFGRGAFSPVNPWGYFGWNSLSASVRARSRRLLYFREVAWCSRTAELDCARSMSCRFFGPL
jgi:hypothetical protein